MLRPYQQEAVDKCMKALNDGVPSVLVAPPGQRPDTGAV